VPAAKVTVEANFSKPIGEVQTEKPKAPEISADMTAVGALEAELAALKRHTERLQQENVTIQRTLATKEAQVCGASRTSRYFPGSLTTASFPVAAPPFDRLRRHRRDPRRRAPAARGGVRPKGLQKLEGGGRLADVGRRLDRDDAQPSEEGAQFWRNSARNSAQFSDGPSVLCRRRRASPSSKTRTPSCTRW